MTEKSMFRWGDGVSVLACLLLVVGCFAVAASAHNGNCVQVQTPDGNYLLSLDKDEEQVFVGQNGLSVTVVIEDGRVSVTKAACDDQICVYTGTLGKTVRTIACVPAGIVISLKEHSTDTPDAVVR